MSHLSRRAQARPPRAGGGRRVVFLCVLAVLAIIMGILSFVNIGGNLILDFARKTLQEQARLNLGAESVQGNPVRGYTLNGITLASEKNETLLSARSLTGRLNFFSLLKGSPRLALLSVGGVNMDLDQFIREIQKIQLKESGGSSEVPVDRISLRDSRFTSRWGKVDVTEIGADVRGQSIELDLEGAVNGVPVGGQADLKLLPGGLSVNKSDIRFGRGRVLATGAVHPVSETDSTTALNLQGSVQGLDLKELTALWPDFLHPQDYDGTAGLNLEVQGTSRAVRLSGTADYKGTRLGGYPVERAGAQFHYADERLSITNIQASALNVPITGDAAIATRAGQPPSVMVRLEGGKAILDDLGKTFPALEGLKGRVESFRANIQGPTQALSGTVDLNAPSVSYRGRTASNILVQLKLAKSDTATLNGKFLFEDAQGYLQGNVASILGSPKLNLTAKLLKLDVKRIADLIPDGSRQELSGLVSASLALRGSPSSPQVSGVLEAPSFSARGYTVRKPSVAFAYAGDTLTLQKSSGTYQGMPVHLSGKVGPLSAREPGVDLTAQLTLSPESLRNFVPDIERWQLKGEVRAGVKIQGRLPRPDIRLVASSPALTAAGGLAAEGLEISTALGGDLSKLDRLSLSARAASLSAGGAALTQVSAQAEKNGTKLRLPSLSASAGAGRISGSGEVNLEGKAPKLDLTFSLNQVDLKALAAGLDLKGTLTGSLRAAGSAGNPELTFSGRVPSLLAQGMVLTGLEAEVTGTPRLLNLNSLKGQVGAASLTASGTLGLTPELKAKIALRGQDLDLAALTAGYPDLKGQIAGHAGLTFDLTAGGTDLGGQGSLTCASLRAFGLSLTDVSLPLSLSGGKFQSRGGKAALYGGRASNSLTFDLSSLKFWDSLSAEGVDVNGLIQDASGGMGGRITGRGALRLDLSGRAGGDLSCSGNGKFTMGPGAITDFTGLNTLTALYGVQGIRYESVTAPLALQTGRLIVKKGSIAKAHDGDPLYRYAQLAEDGSFRFDNKNIYFVAQGNVNYQLINALAGGGRGGLEALLKGGSQSLTSGKGLKDLLAGGLTGAKKTGSQADFRDVTVKVAGRADSPSVSLLEVGPSSLKEPEPQKPDQPAQQEQGAVSPAQPREPAPRKKLEEKIVDSVVDTLIPRKEAPAEPPAPQEEPRQETPQETPEEEPRSLEDQVREKLGDELRKGLGGLFK